MTDPAHGWAITLEQLQLVKYFSGASMALLIYDYFLTLPREVSLVWTARWTFFKILFLFTRYLPFVDFSLRLTYRTGIRVEEKACILNLQASAWCFLIGMSCAEALLTVRTWAIWNRDWRLGVGLPIFFLICWVPAFGVTAMFTKSLTYVPLEPDINDCIAIGSRVPSISWALLLVYEAGISTLMLIEGIKYYKSCGSSKLFSVVFRDGLLYYMFVFLISLANAIVGVVVPRHMQMLLFLIDRFLHSILACRTILDIKEHVSDGFDVTLDDIQIGEISIIDGIHRNAE